MNETAFNLAQELYTLSAWEGVVEWFPDRPVSSDNYPSYDLSYLVRKVRELRPGATTAEILGAVAEFMEDRRLDFEDAAAELCIQLIKQRALCKTA